MKRLCLVMVAFQLISACAWVPSQEEGGPSGQGPSEEAQAAVPVIRLDHAVKGLEVRWGQEKAAVLSEEEIQRYTEKSWVSGPTISLPTLPPDEVEVSVTLGVSLHDLSGLKLTAHSTSGESIENRELRLRAIELGAAGVGSVLRFVIRDVWTVLSEVHEQRIFVTVIFSSDTLLERTLTFALTTPPKKFVTLEDRFAFRRGATESDGLPETLSSQARSRFLLRVLRFRNDGFLPVTVSIPFRTDLKLAIKQRRLWVEIEDQPNPFFMKHVQKGKEEEYTLKSSLFVYPATPELSEKWAGFGQLDLDAIRLLPDETLSLGIYAEDTAIDFLNQYPERRPQIIQATHSAQATCTVENRNLHSPSPNRCEAMNAYGYDFKPEAVSLCRESIQLGKVCERGDPNACNQVALIDSRLDQEFRRPHPDNRKPWPIHFGCKSLLRGADRAVYGIRYAWDWQPLMQNFEVGVQSLAAQFIQSDHSISARVRFHTGNASADQEARELKLWDLPLSVRGGLVRD